jgi:hypothetical protein
MQASPTNPGRSDACMLLVQLAVLFWPLVLGSLYVCMICNAYQYLCHLLVFMFGYFIWGFLSYTCNGLVMMMDLVIMMDGLFLINVLSVSVYLTVCFTSYVCFQ